MQNQIRADFDKETIVVYQAFPVTIALPTAAAKRFVPPFSLTRMTWIKPSFLWLMERSNWGQRRARKTFSPFVSHERVGKRRFRTAY